MAEGLARRLGWEAYSAGVEPSEEVNPYAVKVMAEIDIDISENQPKDLHQFLEKDLDVIVTLCDHANEVCPEFTGRCQDKGQPARPLPVYGFSLGCHQPLPFAVGPALSVNFLPDSTYATSGRRGLIYCTDGEITEKTRRWRQHHRTEQKGPARLFHRGSLRGRPRTAGLGGQEPACRTCTTDRKLYRHPGQRGLAVRLSHCATANHLDA